MDAYLSVSVLIINCLNLYAEKVNSQDTVKAGNVTVRGEMIGEVSLIAGSETGRGEIIVVL